MFEICVLILMGTIGIELSLVITGLMCIEKHHTGLKIFLEKKFKELKGK